ncbi:hypothetical protein HDU83_006845 [Entophlyctis luteolus]|nr:hypothetical protein HDU83_006845 [Entophlyctis luteolus]
MPSPARLRLTLRPAVSPHLSPPPPPPPSPHKPAVTRTVSVPDHLHNLSLESFVARSFAIRKSLARLKILNNEVSMCPSSSSHGKRLSSRNLLPNAVVHAGDVVHVLLPARTSPDDDPHVKQLERLVSFTAPMPQALTLPPLFPPSSILYKDQHILIINKPHDLAVQGGSKVDFNLSGLLDELKFSNDETPKLVHRLDRGTTGCLILARTKSAAAKVSEMLRTGNEQDSSLTKKYVAAVLGKPECNTGVLTTGIVQTGEFPTERASVVEWHPTDGLLPNTSHVKKAVTKYSVLESQRHLSLLELNPVNGRKHQLRLHCAEVLNTPIVGDYKYGPGCPKQLRV